MFVTGVGYILSILYVFFADIKYLYSVFLRILLYLTAIFYPVTSLPEKLQTLIGYNPVYMSILYCKRVYGIWKSTLLYSMDKIGDSGSAELYNWMDRIQ